MRYGPPEVLRVIEVDRPKPRRNQVCIRIGATAVTASDCIARGLKVPLRYQVIMRLAFGLKAPRRILGMVLAGDVEAVGRGFRSFKEGDPVFGLSRWTFGTYAEFVCWPGDALLAPRPANLKLVESLGAESVIDYTKEEFTSREERYDVVLDAVGKRKSASAMVNAGRALAPGGSCISIDDDWPRIHRQDLELLKRLAESGALKPVIDRCYSLEEIVEAHRYVEPGHKKGNVIVTVQGRPGA